MLAGAGSAKVIRSIITLGLAFGLTPLTSYTTNDPAGCIAIQAGMPLEMRGCATQLTAHWAVMAKHGYPLEPPDAIEDKNYDLAFFPHDGKAPIWRDARPGDALIAKCNPLSVADQTIESLFTWTFLDPHFVSYKAHAMFLFKEYGKYKMLVYSGPVYPGCSGGPIVHNGMVAGITSQYFNRDYPAHQRDNHTSIGAHDGDGMAIPASVVMAEFHRLIHE